MATLELKITADATKANTAIEKFVSNLDKIKTSADKASTALKSQDTATDKLTSSVKDLNTKLKSSKTATDKASTGTKNYSKNTKTATSKIKSQGTETKTLNTLSTSLSTTLKTLGTTLAVMTTQFGLLATSTKGFGIILAALAGATALGAVIKGAIDFEDQMLNVRKTTGLTSQDIADLNQRFIDMSKSIPLTTEELADIGTAAGQVGITGVENIEEFTRVIAMMAVTTDLTAEEAAIAMSQLTNVFGIPIPEVENLGSSINELSNTTAATAGQLVDVSLRAGATASSFGLSAAETLGFAATLKDLGVTTEVAGSSLGKIFKKIQTDTKEVAAAADIDFKTFADAVQNEPLEATFMLFDALNALSKTDAQKAMDEMGLGALRVGVSMTKLTDSVDKLKKNVEASTKAYEDNASLLIEFEIFISSVKNQFQLLTNEVIGAATEIGSKLLPTMQIVIDVVKGALVPTLSDIIDIVEENKDSISGFITTIINMGISVSSAIPTLLEFSIAIAGIGAALKALSAISATTALISSFGITVSGISGAANVATIGLGALTSGIGKLTSKIISAVAIFIPFSSGFTALAASGGPIGLLVAGLGIATAAVITFKDEISRAFTGQSTDHVKDLNAQLESLKERLALANEKKLRLDADTNASAVKQLDNTIVELEKSIKNTELAIIGLDEKTALAFANSTEGAIKNKEKWAELREELKDLSDLTIEELIIAGDELTKQYGDSAAKRLEIENTITDAIIAVVDKELDDTIAANKAADKRIADEKQEFYDNLIKLGESAGKKTLQESLSTVQGIIDLENELFGAKLELTKKEEKVIEAFQKLKVQLNAEAAEKIKEQDEKEAARRVEEDKKERERLIENNEKIYEEILSIEQDALSKIVADTKRSIDERLAAAEELKISLAADAQTRIDLLQIELDAVKDGTTNAKELRENLSAQITLIAAQLQKDLEDIEKDTTEVNEKEFQKRIDTAIEAFEKIQESHEESLQGIIDDENRSTSERIDAANRLVDLIDDSTSRRFDFEQDLQDDILTNLSLSDDEKERLIQESEDRIGVILEEGVTKTEKVQDDKIGIYADSLDEIAGLFEDMEGNWASSLSTMISALSSFVADSEGGFSSLTGSLLDLGGGFSDAIFGADSFASSAFSAGSTALNTASEVGSLATAFGGSEAGVSLLGAEAAGSVSAFGTSLAAASPYIAAGAVAITALSALFGGDDGIIVNFDTLTESIQGATEALQTGNGTIAEAVSEIGRMSEETGQLEAFMSDELIVTFQELGGAAGNMTTVMTDTEASFTDTLIATADLTQGMLDFIDEAETGSSTSQELAANMEELTLSVIDATIESEQFTEATKDMTEAQKVNYTATIKQALGLDTLSVATDKLTDALNAYINTTDKSSQTALDLLDVIVEAQNEFAVATQQTDELDGALETLFGDVVLGADEVAGLVNTVVVLDGELSGSTDTANVAIDTWSSYTDTIEAASSTVTTAADDLDGLSSSTRTVSDDVETLTENINTFNDTKIDDKSFTVTQNNVTTGETGGNVPSFDTGTDFVPFDMFARIHKGERIIPAKENAFFTDFLNSLRPSTSTVEGATDSNGGDLSIIKESEQILDELRALFDVFATDMIMIGAEANEGFVREMESLTPAIDNILEAATESFVNFIESTNGSIEDLGSSFTDVADSFSNNFLEPVERDIDKVRNAVQDLINEINNIPNIDDGGSGNGGSGDGGVTDTTAGIGATDALNAVLDLLPQFLSDQEVNVSDALKVVGLFDELATTLIADRGLTVADADFVATLEDAFQGAVDTVADTLKVQLPDSTEQIDTKVKELIDSFDIGIRDLAVSNGIDLFDRVVSDGNNDPFTRPPLERNPQAANGINFVPNDGDLFELHRGERVLTADQNKDFTKLISLLSNAISEGGIGNNKSGTTVIKVDNLFSKDLNSVIDEANSSNANNNSGKFRLFVEGQNKQNLNLANA